MAGQEALGLTLKLRGLPPRVLPHYVRVERTTLERLNAEIARLKERLYGRTPSPNPGRREERCQKVACLATRSQLTEVRKELGSTWRQFENFQKTTIESHAAGEVRRFEAEAVALREQVATERDQFELERKDHRRMTKLARELDAERSRLLSENADLSEKLAAVRVAYDAEMASKALVERRESMRRASEQRELANQLTAARSEADAREAAANAMVAESASAASRTERDVQKAASEAAKRAAARLADAEARASKAEKLCSEQATKSERKLASAKEKTQQVQSAAASARAHALTAEKELREARQGESDAKYASRLLARQVDRAKSANEELAHKLKEKVSPSLKPQPPTPPHSC